MTEQISRSNHYVPKWYQRGFLARGEHKLHILNMQPAVIAAHGQISIREPEIEHKGTKLSFQAFDLYTTRFGGHLNDEVERLLFGEIDTKGATAIRAWINGSEVQRHSSFHDFFSYMDAQKLRTPKGLDWITNQYSGLSQVELMAEMQRLRTMHATMWNECVREIVSAKKSTIKFLVSDHPVCVYHGELSPDAPECQYPSDPGIELIGSHTIFPLDADHCLILTNLEFAENPLAGVSLTSRTNARFRGSGLARTDALIRGRELSSGEVVAINRILKARARQYVAASTREWLFPDRANTDAWRDLGKVLHPGRNLWKFGGETYIGYEDGTTEYRDKFGRTISHDHLAKKPPAGKLLIGDQCGCGSGLRYGECCESITPLLRPSWDVYSIRERNLMLCNAARDILDLNKGATWDDVRRNLSDDQVKKLHEIFVALWPRDTRIADLLPRPQTQRLRAVFIGITDPRTLGFSGIGMLPYLDELVLVHPFINGAAMKPEFSPLHTPAQFKEQLLSNVFLLFQLEPQIYRGRVHLVPDPIDYDLDYRDEVTSIVEANRDKVEMGLGDKWLVDLISRDLHLQTIKRLPETALKSHLRKLAPEMNAEQVSAVYDSFKRDSEEDQLALLQPPRSDKKGAFFAQKGFNRETGLFMAAMTGSIILVESDMQWTRLHMPDPGAAQEEKSEWATALRRLPQLRANVPDGAYAHLEAPPNASASRKLLRSIFAAAWKDDREALPLITSRLDAILAEEGETADGLTLSLIPSMPVGGFRRNDVSRLLITFGRSATLKPTPLAFFLKKNWLNQNDEH